VTVENPPTIIVVSELQILEQLIYFHLFTTDKSACCSMVHVLLNGLLQLNEPNSNSLLPK
jgi:hypothetical protein